METPPKKYLIIDTETSGLFDFSQPADGDGQPRMASLAMIFLDEKMEPEMELSMLIKPVGWTMNAEASAINGLTDEILNKDGVLIADALNQYVGAVDDGHIVVAFNSQFDTKVLRGELRRAGMDDRFEKTPTICTMRASTELVKAPKKTGRGFKFPKLEEACKYFGITNEGAHSALHDARACVQIMRCLKTVNALPEPKVYFAKEEPAPR